MPGRRSRNTDVRTNGENQGGLCSMLLRQLKRICVLVLPALVLAAGRQEARAEDFCCSEMFSCQRTHCPPPLKHCMEGHPRICWKCGCPKPICNPCDQPNW